MNRLPPFRTYSSPSRRAVVRIAARVGAAPGLGQRVRGEPLAARELRQEALLLLLGAGELDPERAELLHGDDQPARRADLRDLFDRHERHQCARADSAVLLVVHDPEQVVLAVQLDHVPRKLGARVDLGGARGDALVRERPHELANLALLVGQRIEDAHGANSSRAHPTGSDGRCQAGNSRERRCRGSGRSVRGGPAGAGCQALDDQLAQPVDESRVCPRRARALHRQAEPVGGLARLDVEVVQHLEVIGDEPER